MTEAITVQEEFCPEQNNCNEAEQLETHQDVVFKNALAALSISAESMEEGLLVLDHAGRILFANSSLKSIFDLGLIPENIFFDEVFGPETSDSVDKDHLVYSEDFYHTLKQMFGPVSTEVAVYRRGRKEFYYLFTLVEYFGDSKVTLCFLKNIAELSSFSTALAQTRAALERTVQEQNYELMRINAQLRIENSERNAVVQALRRAESRYRDIFDNATEGIFQWTPGWKLLAANSSLAGMLGYRSVKSLLEDFSELPFEFCFSSEIASNLISRLERNDQVSNFELQVVRRDGTPVWANMNARRVVAQGDTTAYYEAFIENITDRKHTEEKLLYQAFHDQLTGLANRALFLDRINMSIRRAHRHPGYKFSVLYLDLDRFKVVNDIFGHGTGDEVLCKAAQCILDCVREVDTVARFGGDEFAVLIEDAYKPSMAVRVAKRIHTALKEPFFINGQEVSVGASVGIVLNCAEYSFAEDILRDADSAMYHVKSNQNLYMRVFSQKMRVDTLESIALEADLRNAVKNKEFFMVYQPIVRMSDNSLHGYEALIRWNRKGKVVGPGVFIPVAEETGMIKKLGLFAIEHVCKNVVEWTKKYKNPFVVHVNISGKQLVMPGFPRDVMRILDQTGVDPSYIQFEITESVLLDNTRACIDTIRQIRELGVKFCLDDFGTGFSSLSYLRRLPLDSIKLDRSFVSEVESDHQAVVVVRNLIRLCGDLDLPVVVEGIERPSQVEILSDAGCILAQGYHFYMPLSEEKAVDLLN